VLPDDVDSAPRKGIDPTANKVLGKPVVPAGRG
jgi:hypothetical protein